jgi:DNA-binding SARP family transcriptional activator
LSLWRGPPVAEVAFEDFAHAEIRWLDELRLVALDARVDTDLQLGGDSGLIPELEGLLAEQPTRERIAAQLMTALSRSGRRANAIEVYQRTRTHLSERLGLEPGPALTALQGAILRHDEAVRGGRMLAIHSPDYAPPAHSRGHSKVFSDLVREGRCVLEEGNPTRASMLLAEALGLWRGPPLAEVAFDDFAQGEIRRLEELRFAALETRIDADLQQGSHAALIPELEGLLADQPARERIAAQLMTALYPAGRQSDALEVYQRIRTHLLSAAEFGHGWGCSCRSSW